MIDFAVPLANQNVPYIVLYNRYTGKMRFFFNVFAELGTFQDVALNAGYFGTSSVSGVFRHGNNIDRPLDQETVTSAFSTHFENFNNSTQWFMTDIQLGYDPCVCTVPSEFSIELKGVESSNLDLLARGITVNRPLEVGGKPTYQDYLSISDNELGTGANGALIYKSLDGMLDQYKKQLSIYQTELDDRIWLENTHHKKGVFCFVILEA